MPSQTKENYLKAIFHLTKDQNHLSLTDLSKQLEVSIPTVNSMVKRLQENGWVIYEKYKPLMVTPEGKKAAALVIRKHRIAEMFLVEKMGFGWEEVHNIAEEMEHIHSEAFFDKMDDMLGHPKVDPHGSPIPDKNGKVILNHYQKLSEIPAGAVVRLCALNNDSNDFLHYLNDLKLELGSQMKILKIQPFDQSLTVSYDNEKAVMLSKEVSKRLMVEVVSEKSMIIGKE